MPTLTFRATSRSFAPAIVLVAMTVSGFFIDTASATVILSGTISRSSLKASCDAAGGVYGSGSAGYACTAKGGSVSCNNSGKCYGNCGNCGPNPDAIGRTVDGMLRAQVGGVAVKQVTSTPTKPTAGPVRVNQPVTVSKPVDNPLASGGNQPVTGRANNSENSSGKH